MTTFFARSFSTLTALAAAASIAIIAPAPASAATLTARTLLTQVPVAAEVNVGYDRTLFKHWVDANYDCQNTRQEVLITETKAALTYSGFPNCTVTKGKWISPWDAAVWTLPGDVDIDHHVPLAEAWGAGAKTWTATERKNYANDLYGPALNAITDNLNSSKSDRDPAEWLPPIASTRCEYAITWVQVKYRWRLSMDTTERNTLNSIISGTCGDRVITIPVRAR